MYNKTDAKGLIFNVGFLTSITIICYYPSVFLMFFSLFSLAVLRPFRPAEWLVLLLGLVAPFYILLSILYLFDFNFNSIVFSKFGLLFSINTKDYWAILNLFFLSLLTIISLFIWYPNSSRLVILIRKNWILLLFLFFSTLLMIPFFPRMIHIQSY
jgi:hypothetical protein